ncbi:MAG: hypothetical protein GX864_00680 [Mollicutes bacterium]|nr:hypothetical protein [Mollicutes bacterium]
MEDNIQIGLFFSRKHIFDPLTMANNFKEKIKSLGEVVLLPVDEKNNNPVIIFDKGEDIRLVITFTNIMITFQNDQDKFFKDSMKKIMEILKKSEMDITRIGYINNKVLGTKEADLFKNNAFDNNEILESDEFQLSYYKKDKIDKLNINCWKRYFTDYEKFIVSFDINTLIDEQHDINYKFVLDFVDKSQEYISSKQIVKLI